MLPPPPPAVPSSFVPEVEQLKKTTLLPMARRGCGSKGQKIPLLTNHFSVNFNKASGHLFHYSVAITYEDGRPVEAKGIGRKILDKVQETYKSELGSKYFAYDGEKTLFTVSALPSNKLEFSVVLENVVSSRNNTGNTSPEETNDGDKKRSRRPNQSNKFMVEISYAAKIPMQATSAIQGKETDNLQDAIRVLDIILRQSAARQGCLLVRLSFFHNDAANFVTIGGGVIGCRGYHSSFRTTQGGLSLNMDTSTTMIVQPGAVVDFLLANQNAKIPGSLDWNKARRTLKSLRVSVAPSNREYKITGLSEQLCKNQLFTRNLEKDYGEVEEVETTVSPYFHDRRIDLQYSGDMPCINVGKPKRPTTIPTDFCELVPLQRYTRSLTNLQRTTSLTYTRSLTNLQRMTSLTTGLKKYQGGNEKKEEEKEEEDESSGAWSYPRQKAAARKRTEFQQDNEVATFIDLETVAFKDGTNFSQVRRKLDALVAESMRGSVKLEEGYFFCAQPINAYMLVNDENEKLRNELEKQGFRVESYIQRKAYCVPACRPSDSPSKSELLELEMAEDLVDCFLQNRSKNQKRGICIISKDPCFETGYVNIFTKQQFKAFTGMTDDMIEVPMHAPL